MAQESAIEGEQQAIEQGNKEAMNQIAEMLKAMQVAIGQMGNQFSNSLVGIHSQMNAPKRVIRDETGEIVGVEVVPTTC